MNTLELSSTDRNTKLAAIKVNFVDYKILDATPEQLKSTWNLLHSLRNNTKFVGMTQDKLAARG